MDGNHFKRVFTIKLGCVISGGVGLDQSDVMEGYIIFGSIKAMNKCDSVL